MGDDLFNYQPNVNPFDGTGVRSVMSEQEALKQIPDTITYGQIAAAQQTTTPSPGLLNKWDQEEHKDFWNHQKIEEDWKRYRESGVLPGLPLQAPDIDPVDILVAGATGGGSLGARFGRMGISAGKSLGNSAVKEATKF